MQRALGSAVLVTLGLLAASAPVEGQGGPVSHIGLQPGTVSLQPAGGGMPVSHPTIQAAVDAAAGGDTILLSEGVYSGAGNRDVLVTGKDVVIRAAGDVRRTVISCQRRGRGFRFDGALVTPATVLQGVTIVDGEIFGFGGGILCENDALPTIAGCVVTRCRSNGGGGIRYRPTPGLVPSGVIRDCILFGNVSFGGGGGIEAGDITIERCVVRDNVAAIDGGGLNVESVVEGRVTDTLVARNHAQRGGGIATGSLQLVEGCTIVDNTVDVVGGGVFFRFCPQAVLSNSIVWGNASDGIGPQIFQEDGLFGTTVNPTIRYCDVEGGPAGIVTGPTANPLVIALLGDDPAFADAAAGDYALTVGSPCVDAGDPAFNAAVNQGDVENQPRQSGTVDIGADELWDGLALSLVSPGRAGQLNTVEITGATPGECVMFFSGSVPGPLDLSFPSCPGLFLGIADAAFLVSLTAAPDGTATYAQFVPSNMSGATILLQGIGFDPANPGMGCTVSNLVSFLYP